MAVTICTETISAVDFINHYNSHTSSTDGSKTKLHYFRHCTYRILSITYSTEHYPFSGACSEDFFNSSSDYSDYVYIPKAWVSDVGYAVANADWDTDVLVQYSVYDNPINVDWDTDSADNEDSLPVEVTMGDRECTYSYILRNELYEWNNEFTNLVYLKILKDGLVLSDEHVSSLFEHYANDEHIIAYAEKRVQALVDKCIASRKIETTCCLLVCCEPDKYKLI